MKLKHFLIVCLLITVHWLLLFNLRFEAWPEMLVYPYLLNHGFKLYQDIINPYPPLFTTVLASFFSLVNLSVANLKIFTWSLILLTDLLIFFIAHRRFGLKAGLVALAFFVLFQPLLDGNGLWYDLALTPVLLLAFYFNSPVLLSAGFLMKQSVIWFFPLMYRQWKQLLVSLGCLFLFFAIIFALQGNLQAYLFWPWRFALTILPTLPGHKDFGSPPMWLIALTPFIPVALLKKTKPFYWIILSFLFIFPRFGLFHLQPALAFASLSLAASLQSIKLRRLHFYAFMPFTLIISLLWYRQITLFWHKPTRFFEPEILAAAQKLKSATSADKPILFLNAPDQLMVLADRLPVKPWAITFPWYLELPGFQQRVISAVEDQQVTSVIFSPGFYRPKDLDDFINQHFPEITPISDQIQLKSRTPPSVTPPDPANEVLVTVTAHPTFADINILNFYPSDIFVDKITLKLTATPSASLPVQAGSQTLGTLTYDTWDDKDQLAIAKGQLKKLPVTNQPITISSPTSFDIADIDFKIDNLITDKKLDQVTTRLIDSAAFRLPALNFPSTLSGTYLINQTTVLPQGMPLNITPGTTIKFAPGASLIVSGKVTAVGTPAAPITFTGQTSKPWGVFALVGPQAAGSEFDYVTVDSAGDATVNGMYFSGGLAVHSADVTINHSLFRSNHGDDGLNVKQAQVTIINSQFINNGLDGLDLDVVTGDITRNTFANNGNDGLDISFSEVLIEKNHISDNGDKCLSFGEKSQPRLIDNDISGCNIGIAVKDLSQAHIDRNRLINNHTAIAAYQKKPIFGGGTVIFGNNQLIDNQQDFDISPGSQLRHL
ncbi:MAG: hypothetical protein A2784_00105 [Candidatus Chisholmbacteria bacterium RIFCSPHIGHO2_01_FULL_48_12]|uniref:Right handed beta helix domain-containing protein n=1 Tax=Candidatus Chisholmbacteria bacterium RIFCSPHIGHO2_01_FULL_48_12 TaxID=1797589 RepID=A0A1G1VVD9_9BACT|nr:MAG: hypothetical protein A2784_00105 [Candidatus Chisholmbacteria bacterium RIFCSPHIGHO2_01_FULL_48_12]